MGNTPVRDQANARSVRLPDGASSTNWPVHSMALVPPEPLARVFASQRDRFDREHATTIPHVTMKLSFGLGEGTLKTQDDLRRWLERECRDQRPFEVWLDEAGMFGACSGYGYVVYVPVRATPALIGLHARLVQGLADGGARTSGVDVEREVAMFFPHLTLAQGLTVEEAQLALTVARRELAPVMFLADRLVTAWSADGERWTVDGEVRFCGEPVAASSAGVASPKDPARSGKSEDESKDERKDVSHDEQFDSQHV